MHDHGGPIQFSLQKPLIGLVADRIRHRAVAVGNHAVGGNDGVPFDTMLPDHEE